MRRIAGLDARQTGVHKRRQLSVAVTSGSNFSTGRSLLYS
jgi:hypothetical protein